MTNTETKKMSEVIHWSLFIACVSTLGIKILEISAQNSALLIRAVPEIAQYSWLAHIVI